MKQTVLSYPSIHGRSMGRRLAHRGLATRRAGSRGRLPRKAASPSKGGAFFSPRSAQQVERIAVEIGRAALAAAALAAWGGIAIVIAG